MVNLQRLKTGQLFEFSCEAGPILGQASAEDRARLRAYAREMGVVFQITDDLLDVTSTAEKTGKAVGKDAEMGKATLVTLLGVEGARAEAEKRAHAAIAALGPHAAHRPNCPACRCSCWTGSPETERPWACFETFFESGFHRNFARMAQHICGFMRLTIRGFTPF